MDKRFDFQLDSIIYNKIIVFLLDLFITIISGNFII